MDAQQPSAGWYPDPRRPSELLRWWDGTRWSESLRELPGAPASVQAEDGDGATPPVPAPEQGLAATTAALLSPSPSPSPSPSVATGGPVPHRAAWTVQILAGLVGLLFLISATKTAQLHALLDAEDFSAAERVANEVDGLALAGLVGMATTFIALCVWERLARRSRAADRSLLTQSDAWALWSWIVPVVWLWVPFIGMRDLERASRPRVRPRTDGTVLLGAWWASWLLASVVATLAQTNLLRSESAPNPDLTVFKEAVLAHGLSQWVICLATPLFILVVRRITGQLAERAREGAA